MIGDGEVLERVVVALPRGSVISGRITDEFGDPIANANVSAIRYGYAGGTRRTLPAGGQGTRDTTDDLGQFRLFGLMPGDYYVTAALRMNDEGVTDPGADITGFAPTYFPGVSSLGDAQRVTVGLGQEMNVAFGLVAAKLVRVSGSVMNSNGMPAGGMVMLLPADMRNAVSNLMTQGGGGRLDNNGRFRLTNVAPGSYVLQVGGIGPGNGEVARLPLTVGAEDVNNVVLVTSSGATVSGRIVSDTGEPPALTPRDITVVARPANLETMPMLGGGQGRVSQTWGFELTGLIDARLFRVNAPSGWALDAVLLNGQDITDTPVEFSPGQKLSGMDIVLTNKLTTVSGSVTDANGQPALDTSVLIFPSDDRLWTEQSRFIRTARPDQEGRFQIRGLPAHDTYLVVAVQDLEDGQGYDPDFLASVRIDATSLKLGRGETLAVDLRTK
jgi:hypothetical protein